MKLTMTTLQIHIFTKISETKKLTMTTLHIHTIQITFFIKLSKYFEVLFSSETFGTFQCFTQSFKVAYSRSKKFRFLLKSDIFSP